MKTTISAMSVNMRTPPGMSGLDDILGGGVIFRNGHHDSAPGHAA